MKHEALLIDAVRAALAAGQAILEVYQTDFSVQTKADDSPLTLADQRSHRIIKAALAQHGLPFLSEEGRSISYAERSQWRRLWIVDPLDGTKEFVKRNGEFTVNIALIEGQTPVMGVVYAPIPQSLYFASVGIGAFKLSKKNLRSVEESPRLDSLLAAAEKMPIENQPSRKVYTIVGSRSHATPELAEFVERKKEEKGEVEFIQAGSALKICLVAEGAADIYPRLGPTMEWDTAAGQAVAEGAGATVVEYSTDRSLLYNKPDLLNPWFVVERFAPRLRGR